MLPDKLIRNIIAEMMCFILLFSVLCSGSEVKQKPNQAEPIAPTKSPYVLYEIPDGNYANGKLIKFKIENRAAFLVAPKGYVDDKKRWVWISPASLGISYPQDNNKIAHHFYVEALLAKGFHIGGVDVGISCGSPKGVDVCQSYYKYVTEKYNLNPKTRFIAQSNGGLIAYAWAFRHPECVDRVFGIYPVTDMTTWPRLQFVVGPGSFPEPELAYGLTLEELSSRVKEFNPIDNLKPLADAGVKIFHIHGDRDTDKGVPWDKNTFDFIYKYRLMGGKGDFEIYYGRGHGASGEGGGIDITYMDEIFYHSLKGLDFLLED